MNDETQSSETGQNRKPGTFRKGDPRINRLGRPRSFDALRELGQQIAHEAAIGQDGQPIVFDKHAATVAEMIMRSWAKSNSPQLQRAFIEVAFGKVPDDVHLRIDRMSDAEVAEVFRPYLARLGIGIEPPGGKRLDATPGDGAGAMGAASEDATPATGEIH